MDHYSILDCDSLASTGESGLSIGETHPLVSGRSRSAPSRALGISARITASEASATTPVHEGSEPAFGSSPESTFDSQLRFPGEDGGRSLTALAESDLDAALQLLAERAQYITGASGAAIALRRGAISDMVCRASAGSNAPELGALLSTEQGLSGESVRTRRALRCDDAERDPRVNRDGCRQLGIASVVIMPIVGDGEVIGVFELFSGKPHAFNERDLSALERLGGMVETAVQHATVSQTGPAIGEILHAGMQRPLEGVEARAADQSSSALPRSAPSTNTRDADSKKPLFWSAVLQADSATRSASHTKPPLEIPPVLRQLQKCQTCGFPVSPSRIFCVECEDKQWRNESLPLDEATPKQRIVARETPHHPAFSSEHLNAAPVAIAEISDEAREMEGSASNRPARSPESVEGWNHTDPLPLDEVFPEIPEALFGSALPPQSWFAANKYLVGALLIALTTVAAVALLR
ncbi:MAG: GAF domain-containing protein [Candidatus Sulfotelmatobacter sp.]